MTVEENGTLGPEKRHVRADEAQRGPFGQAHDRHVGVGRDELGKPLGARFVVGLPV